jgi:hypothetical protein
MIRRWPLFAALAPLLAPLVLTASCVQPAPPRQPDGMAQLGRCQVASNGGPVLPDQGIGGTGGPAMPTQLADRGIGGTGVVGVITGFASVCLNGLEVDLVPSTVIAVDGAQATGADLRVGQLAVVTTTDRPDGRMTARLVRVRHEVSGPVEQIDGEHIVVAGQDVIVPPTAIQADLAGLGAGIAVSGVRDFDGVIIASRLDPASATHLLVHGRVQPGADGAARIGRLVVPTLLDDGTAPAWVMASGRVESGRAILDAVAPDPGPDDPVTYFEQGARRFIVEAYVKLTAGHVMFGTGLQVAARPDVIERGARDAGAAIHLAVVTIERQRDGTLLATGWRDSANGGGNAFGRASPHPATSGLPAFGRSPAAPSPAAVPDAAPVPASGNAPPAGPGGNPDGGRGAAKR